jgi:hypothetical protein
VTLGCPAVGCDSTPDGLMCRTHWLMLPMAIRAAVWISWRDGDGDDTPQHRAAIEAAIRSVNEQTARRSVTP